MNGTAPALEILQFGRSGQLGSALVGAMVEDAGIHLTALGRDDADFTDPSQIAQAIASAPNLDVVINAVAYTAVDRAEQEEALAYRVNAEAVEAMARACSTRGVPLIHVSTDYVYDGAKPAPYVESDATGPINAYGRTKLAGENLIRQHQPAHVILRTSWVYSAQGQNFLKTMLRLGKERDEVRVVDDQHGAPTSARDLADAIVTIARRIASGTSDFGTYHYANAGEVSWCDFAAEIFRQARLSAHAVPIPTTAYPTPARRPANSRLDTVKISRIFGIRPPAWQTSLAAVLAGMEEKRI
jgi:dTDP-4-dehydrorhamnose reductase